MEEAVDTEAPASQPKTRSVAARVAARYAKAPTYSEMLAHEARNAARAAEAAAVAAGEARDAAQAILVGLDAEMHDVEGESVDSQASSAHRQSRLSPATHEAPVPEQRSRPFITEASEDNDFGDMEEPTAPVQPLPANLLEFPRELIATRKARPRLAEGPLREEYDRDAGRSQLRIFEVAPETISTDPVVEPVLPEWSQIRLDSLAETHPASRRSYSRVRDSHVAPGPNSTAPATSESASFDLPLQVAPLEDRMMAGLVDGALVIAGFLVFVLVFAACTAHPPVGKPAQVGAALALLAFAAIYQVLFFNFGSDTPGMRYAKIALCTFDDENPTRQTMRRRLGAVLLSASPMGLGILWAFFDDDRLGWHDRISRTYQRSYR
jgi:uncharacterized RDD family membrane protein YckC